MPGRIQKELAESKIRVQAVLPGATTMDFREIVGTPVERLHISNYLLDWFGLAFDFTLVTSER